jgi:hypothetical protein
MNFVDVREGRPGHPHLEQTRVIRYARPSGIVFGKQAGTVGGALRKDLRIIERRVRQVRRNREEHCRLRSIPDWRADDLMHMGVLFGEVYDDRIIQECLHREKNSH